MTFAKEFGRPLIASSLMITMSSLKPHIHPSDRFDRIGMVARWQPVHLGHAPVLRAFCERAAQPLIGIGSSNRYDLRNPFSLEERVAMIRLVLADYHNYTFMPVSDLDDGPRWRAQVVELFGALDLFVTDNPYVASLLAGDYPILRPVELVPQDQKIAIDGSMVRREMARGDGWRELVPPEIEVYIMSKRLDQRFRREFGLQTLALDAIVH
jgi:nicotinamide-nucleotide adenylyltransferase